MASLATYGITPQPGSSNPMAAFLQSLQNSLTASGEQAFGTGQAAFSEGLQDFAPAQAYWSDILSGNRSEMESAIAPEKASILDQYRARRRSRAQLGSRSGGTNEAETQSGYAQAGDIAALLQKLRPQAAQGTADIASSIAGLGVQESQIGNEQIFNALQAAISQRGQNLGQQATTLGFAGNLISALV